MKGEMPAEWVVVLLVALAAVAWAIWARARKSPAWRLDFKICPSHGGDAVERCACSEQFCRTCIPEGHCHPGHGVGRETWRTSP